MEKTPSGTSVGVDDPYDFAGLCDHLTSEGTCRYAFEHPEQDPEFARERRADEFRCPAVDGEADHSPGVSTGASETPDGEWEWKDCSHYRCRNRDRECMRCGLEETRIAHSDERPLLEEHHLSYDETPETTSHEITVYLCRWCHAKVHDSWARITDDANPDPEAIAAKEGRKGREQAELSFQTAAEKYDSSTKK